MNSRAVLNTLSRHESRNVTFIDPDGTWPIVWERASGVSVWDAEGRRYLDLTAAFGVAAAGHANPRVVRAGQRQMARLLHAMGDVHPHALKARLARELSRITFERWARGERKGSGQNAGGHLGKTIFCNSGFEAVEAALKTAVLSTGRRGVIAFEGAYHGLGYGTLNATHRDHFRGPFRSQLAEFGRFVPYPVNPHFGGVNTASPARESQERGQPVPGPRRRAVAAPNLIGDGLTGREPGRAPTAHLVDSTATDLEEVEATIRSLFRREKIGAILVEPIQARGGIRVPVEGFLPMLARLCAGEGALLILDEIYTGFGRTGRWFACEHSCVVPDLICLGKALTGGFPLSACVGRADLMDAAWPATTGEAIHTSTFLGHPVGCSMALAQIAEIRRRRLPAASARLGRILLRWLFHLRPPTGLKMSVRGRGLMAGVELTHPDGSPAAGEALQIVKRLLHRGVIVLPEGEAGNVISLTPPLSIGESQLRQGVNALQAELDSLG